MENMRQQAIIYIGLNDHETGKQEFDTDKYLTVLKNTCRGYKVSFSVQESNGGYISEEGEYVEENTLMLRLIDVPEDIVIEIAKDMCVYFNQECVMVVTNPASVVFVSETLE